VTRPTLRKSQHDFIGFFEQNSCQKVVGMEVSAGATIQNKDRYLVDVWYPKSRNLLSGKYL